MCLKQKLGTAAIIEKFQQAFEMVIRTKSYTQKEYDVGLLVLRLAGSKVAKILYQFGVIPSESTLHRVFKMNRSKVFYSLEYSNTFVLESNIN